MRLRDLAGLIVIDFIDMEEKRNNRSVERKLKDALKNDRARIQVGRISHFGLLEMSRQRIRTGVLESTTTVCPTCQGSGHVRAPASVALHVLRSLEDQLLKGATHNLTIRTRTSVALYILNQKRAHLSEIEQRFGLSITVTADETIANGAHFVIERGEPVEHREIQTRSIQPDSVMPELGPEDEAVEAIAEEPDVEVEDESDERAAPHRARTRTVFAAVVAAAAAVAANGVNRKCAPAPRAKKAMTPLTRTRNVPRRLPRARMARPTPRAIRASAGGAGAADGAAGADAAAKIVRPTATMPASRAAPKRRPWRPRRLTSARPAKMPAPRMAPTHEDRPAAEDDRPAWQPAPAVAHEAEPAAANYKETRQNDERGRAGTGSQRARRSCQARGAGRGRAQAQRLVAAANVLLRPALNPMRLRAMVRP